MTERQFTNAVMRVGEQLGWKAAHFGNTLKVVRGKDGQTKVIPDRDATGFPDLVLTRDGRLVFAELKVGRGRPTPSQQNWLDALHKVTERALDATGMSFVEVFTWTTADWDEIREVLT